MAKLWGAQLTKSFLKQRRGPGGKWIKQFAGASNKSAIKALNLPQNRGAQAAALGALVTATVALGSKRNRTRVTSRSAMHSRQLTLKIPKLGTLSTTGTVTFKRNQTGVEKGAKKKARDLAYELTKHGTKGKIAGALIDNKLSYGTMGSQGNFTIAPRKTRKMKVSVSHSSANGLTARVGKTKLGSAKGAGSNGMPKTRAKATPRATTGGGGSKVATSYGPRPQRRNTKKKGKK